MDKWVEVLKAACERTSQAEVAKALRRAGNGKFPSAATINQVIQGKYPSNLARLQALVEGVLMGETVECPIIGDLPRARCVEHQGRKFAATNPLRVALAQACPECGHRINTNGEAK